MKKSHATRYPSLLLIALGGLLIAQPILAESKSVKSSSDFEVCLIKAPGEHSIMGGWTETYRLHFQQEGKAKPSLYQVSALISGVQVTAPPFPSFSHQLAGTATVAVANNALSTGSVLQVSLSGASFGSDVNGDKTRSGIVKEQFNFQLDPVTFNGVVTGNRSFGLVQTDNVPYADENSQTVQLNVVKTPCPAN